jgi:hypothetical protein
MKRVANHFRVVGFPVYSDQLKRNTIGRNEMLKYLELPVSRFLRGGVK